MDMQSYELRQCGYTFFANVASLLGADFAPLLGPVVAYCLGSIDRPTSGFEGELEHSDSEDDGDEEAGDAFGSDAVRRTRRRRWRRALTSTARAGWRHRQHGPARRDNDGGARVCLRAHVVC